MIGTIIIEVVDIVLKKNFKNFIIKAKF